MRFVRGDRLFNPMGAKLPEFEDSFHRFFGGPRLIGNHDGRVITQCIAHCGKIGAIAHPPESYFQLEGVETFTALL